MFFLSGLCEDVVGEWVWHEVVAHVHAAVGARDVLEAAAHRHHQSAAAAAGALAARGRRARPGAQPGAGLHPERPGAAHPRGAGGGAASHAGA